MAYLSAVVFFFRNFLYVQIVWPQKENNGVKKFFHAISFKFFNLEIVSYIIESKFKQFCYSVWMEI